MWINKSVDTVGVAFLTSLKVTIYKGFNEGWAKFQNGGCQKGG